MALDNHTNPQEATHGKYRIYLPTPQGRFATLFARTRDPSRLPGGGPSLARTQVWSGDDRASVYSSDPLLQHRHDPLASIGQDGGSGPGLLPGAYAFALGSVPEVVASFRHGLVCGGIVAALVRTTTLAGGRLQHHCPRHAFLAKGVWPTRRTEARLWLSCPQGTGPIRRNHGPDPGVVGLSAAHA